MATTKITNTQIDNLVNAAYRQAVGSDDVSTQLDLTAFTETGAYNTDFTAVREKFTGALVAKLTKDFYLDSAYTGDTDPFYTDSREFGAVTQMINITAPEVRENSSWETFSNGDVIGTAEVSLPIINSKLTCATTSWGLPITITDQQWDDAVKNREEFDKLISFIMLAVRNAIEVHKESTAALNRNNMIGELLYADQQQVDGVHAINLVAEYAAEVGETTMTVEDFLSTADALRFASERIKTIIRYMGKMTTIFNTASRATFTPKDRLVVELLGTFVDKVESKMEANTFHSELVALPNYHEVASWQSLSDITFDGVSSINVKTADGHGIEKAGIIGLVADRWSIIHTIRSQRVGRLRDDIKALTAYEYQFRDSRMNNLECNAVVFYLDDVTA